MRSGLRNQGAFWFLGTDAPEKEPIGKETKLSLVFSEERGKGGREEGGRASTTESPALR